MNQRPLRPPRRQLVMALTLGGLLVLGGPLVLPLLISMAAFGEVVPCQDGGVGCDEDVLVLPHLDTDGFDRELFASDGANTSEVFDAGSYRQATFRLAQLGGEASLDNWDQFVEVVSLLTNVADSMHGIPLLIAKVHFTTMPPKVRTFFMAALAAETIYHQDITILSPLVFQFPDDPVERIQLHIEGKTVDVDPAGMTPVRFTYEGEKTILATIHFASGFVGKNLFRVVVRFRASATSQRGE
jgi:hypothetical protein